MSKIFFSEKESLQKHSCKGCDRPFWTYPFLQERKFCSEQCWRIYAKAYPRRKIPTCHPERKHYGRGYCAACWQAHWSPNLPGSNPAKCHPDRPNQGHGLCLECYNRQSRQNGSNKARRLRYTFGLTLEQYEHLLKLQNGKCAICGEPERKIRLKTLNDLAVDHDACNGLIRGLLCHRCNLGIGHFRDNPYLLAKAIAYLAEPRNLRPEAQAIRPQRGARSRMHASRILHADRITS